MSNQFSLLLFAIGVLMLFSLVTDAREQRKSISAAEVNGTFQMSFKGEFSDSSNVIKLLALGRGKIRVAMDLIYPYRLPNGELSANLGELGGEASINGDTAIHESSEFGPCRITIKFVRSGTIMVTQSGSDADCGFGHNVYAGGTYRKVSSRKPKFED